jgi:hypothetical protein
MELANTELNAPLRVLVALASYGSSNDRYLDRLLHEYQSMTFDVDIVIVSNIEKCTAPGIECLVGLPDRNPWSLPFAHKKLFADRVDRYDIFIYSEDDILITEKNLRAFLDATAVLHDDEIAGFLRIEKSATGEANYPDVHAYFHWDTATVRSRGKFTLANFTNEHAACYVLTQGQLEKAIKSGGFLVDPHEGKYDLLCAAATDPYVQCGYKKLIPISHMDDFTVHHLSNKYVGRVGVDASELRTQIGALLQLPQLDQAEVTLFNTETRLWRCAYSKDYYEPVCREVISAIPSGARSVLSIGCGWGATEISLVESGMRVVAVPLDPVISSSAASRGVKFVYGDFRNARATIDVEKFDCVLYLNVLHLIPDPVDVLSLFKDVGALRASFIVQSPNMRCIPAIWRNVRSRRFEKQGDYESTGVHLTSVGKVQEWCRSAGLVADRTVGILHRRAAILSGVSSGNAGLSMSPEFVTVARKAEAFAQLGSRREDALV